MQSFRGNLAQIPNALTNFISNTTTTMSPVDGASVDIPESTEHNSVTYGSMSGDEGSDKSHAIPSSLIKEQWQLVLDQDASIDELTNAIERCKELVMNTDECSTERKWLVRHLVELRFRLREMEDALNDSSKTGSTYKVCNVRLVNTLLHLKSINCILLIIYIDNTWPSLR